MRIIQGIAGGLAYLFFLFLLYLLNEIIRLKKWERLLKKTEAFIANVEKELASEDD